jgi:hypothetical protein
MTHAEKIREGMKVAATLPKIHFSATLAAHLVMAGFKLVPEDLWDKLSEKLDKIDLDLPVAGDFKSEHNHMRSGDHEVWQCCCLPERYEEGTWVIPCDELVEIQYDGEYSDFVSLTRLMFTGTEEEMRKQVNILILETPNCD